MDGLGLTEKEDVSSDLRNAKIKKNAADIKSTKETINNTMNHFSSYDLDPLLLYNIGSGKATSPQTTEFLLNIDARGNEKQDTFIYFSL